MTARAHSISDAVSGTVMTTIRKVVDANAGRALRHADIVRVTGYPADMTYVALRRLQDTGQIRAEFLRGEGGIGTGTYYTAKGTEETS